MAAPNPFVGSPQASGAGPSSPQHGPGPMDQFLEAMGHIVSSSHELHRALAESMAQRNEQRPNWARVLPKPETWKPKSREEELSGWADFDWSLVQYMQAVDPATADLMVEIQGKPDDILDHLSTPDPVVQQSKSLYALLSCLVRERPLQIVKSVPESNGFEAYRVLMKTLAPTSKSRAQAIVGAIANYPSFSEGQLLEQILKFEQLHMKYHQASGKEVSDELISAVLLRSLPNDLRAHVTVNLPESCSYRDLRELLLRWDRSNQRWSSQTINAPSASSNDPVPMDIDQVRASGKWGKGKSKGKGKYDSGKGKHSQHSSPGWQGGGWPKDFKGGKDKGKGKGKNDKGGKAWGKDGKAKGKGNCRLCGQPGHWKNECWMNKQVSQVQRSHALPTAQAYPNHATVPPSSTTQPSAQSPQPPSNKPASVKRVFVLHDSPECFKLDSDAESFAEPEHDAWRDADSWWCRVVRFSMDDPTDQDLTSCSQDGYTVRDMTWCDFREHDSQDMFEAMCESVRGVRRPLSPSSARPLATQEGWQDIILDSGADVSVMPESWMSLGHSSDGELARSIQLLDAQGTPMPHHGHRTLDLDLGDIIIQEEFSGTSVENPLSSLGKLFKNGWELRHFHEGPNPETFLCFGDEVTPCFLQAEQSVRPCMGSYPSGLFCQSCTSAAHFRCISIASRLAVQ